MYGLPLAEMKYRIKVLCLFIVVVILAIMVPTPPVLAAPAISISPISGVPGTTVNVSGTSFSSYASDQLHLYIDDTQINPSGGSVSGSSYFQATFVVPDSVQPGYHFISIRGTNSQVLAEKQFYVPDQEITLSVWSGTVGTTIEAFCKGFHAGKDVNIQYYYTNSSQILASQTANDVGECTEQFTIPASSTGSHVVLAQNEFGDSAQTEFEVIPSLSINPAIVGIGDEVNVLGTGFAPNTEVVVTLHGKGVAIAQVSERGSFVAIFYVPVIKVGTYAIEISDSTPNKKWIDLTIESKITLNKASGVVGTKLLVNGTGFEVGGIIQIKYDDVLMTTVIAESDGSFSANFEAPISIAGDHIVTVTDGLNTKQVVFAIESEPPPVPKPTTPKLDSVVAAQVSFDWESVYDPSEPVSYTLQIARTADFAQPILEKEGLSLSHYELTKDEALRPSRRSTYYYWRVRATDSASNEGAWSNPIAFQVEPSSVLPEWAEYVLVFIGILLVIIAVFIIRNATKSPKKRNYKLSLGISTEYPDEFGFCLNHREFIYFPQRFL